MSKTSYRGPDAEGIRNMLDSWTQNNCTSYSASDLSSQTGRADDYSKGDILTKASDTAPMTNQSDFRHEMELRDQSIQREIKVRERAFRRELAAHNRLMDYRIEKMEAATNQVVEATKASRYWMAGIGVAVILGIMGANATLVGSAGSIFDGGKAALQRQQDLENLARQAQEQSAKTQKILEAVQAQQQQVQQPKP